MTDLPFPLFTSCKFILNDRIPYKDGELFKLFTNKLNFKIIGIDPLIVEKDWPSQEDLTTLVEALKSLLPPNSDNWNLEQRQRESFQLQATTENTGDYTRYTDIQALGKNDDKCSLIKNYNLKRIDVSTDFSANQCVENVSSEDTTTEEISKVSADSRVNDILPTPKNTTEAHKELTTSQRKKSSRETENSETINRKVKPQKSKYDLDPIDPQSHKLTYGMDVISSVLPERQLPPQLSSGCGIYSGNNEHNIFTKSQNAYYVKREGSKLRVKMLNADITKLEVDCIVNAANKRLEHIGGVSRAISSAAGRTLNKECEDFILSSNQVDVTDIFISTGGNLPAKCVMHAVGPKWYEYSDQNKALCLEDLRHTVIRCLVEAGRQGFTSIALPSISAAIFRVPKEACARCYMEAVKHFGTFNKEQTSLREIYFVDVDDSMVKIIQDHFEKNWTNPCNPHIVQRDCDFASTHFYFLTRNATKCSKQLRDTSKTASSSVSVKTSGAKKSYSGSRDRPPASSSTETSTSDKREEVSPAYQIGKFILHTDSRPAFDIPSDITITVGKPFDKLSGLRDFSVSKNKQTKESVKNRYTLFNVSKPKSQQQKLVCALLPEPDDAETIKEALGNLDIILQSPNHKIFSQKITKVILTSSFLYKEPDNINHGRNKNCFDRKKAGYFARDLFDYIRLSPMTAASTISITLVGCEDALSIVHKVIEARGVIQLSPSAQQGARNKTRENSQLSKMGISAGQFSVDASEGIVSTRRHLEEGTCEMCYQETYPLKCCGKHICQRCQNEFAFCPYCRTFWRILTGDQPPGTMSVNILQYSVAGYEQSPTLEIKYYFPSERQKDCHPNPGKVYTAVSHTAYLPATVDGLRVLKLLRLAFLRKLTFTIGRHLISSEHDSIILNDIHHKSSLYSGGLCGYPDPNYLYDVTQELASKGVLLETASADERRRLEDFEKHIATFKCFSDIYPI